MPEKSPRFAASLYALGDPKPLTVSIEVEADGVRLFGAEVKPTILSYDTLGLRRGGYQGDFLFLDDRALGCVMCNEPGLEPALRRVPHPVLVEQLAALGEVVRTRRRSRRVGLWVTLALLALAGVAFWKAPVLLAEAAMWLPASVDREIGDQAFAHMAVSGARVDDQRLRGLADEIVQRVSPHAKPQGIAFRVAIVATAEPNAFALPGGQMVLQSGLVSLAENGEQVAAVMAHEMAHVTLRHGVRNLIRQAGMMLALSLLVGDAGGLAEVAGQAALLAGANAYSRAQEAEADAEGARMMAAAGLDPMALAHFFVRMGSVPGTELPKGLGWLSSHPNHEQRREAISTLSPVLPRAAAVPLNADFAAAKAAAREANDRARGVDPSSIP